jgi:hypothetical protein
MNRFLRLTLPHAKGVASRNTVKAVGIRSVPSIAFSTSISFDELLNKKVTVSSHQNSTNIDWSSKSSATAFQDENLDNVDDADDDDEDDDEDDEDDEDVSNFKALAEPVMDEFHRSYGTGRRKTGK